MLDAGGSEGSLDHNDIEYIKNVFKLDGMTAGEVMTPRRSMVLVSEDAEQAEILQIIEEEAFCGCTAIFRVEVPEGITEIRSRAFAESTLHEISLPGSLVYIADDAFMGCLDFCVEAEEGTYAYNWAEENGWPILNPVDETPEPSESIRPTATPAPEQGEDELPWV